MSHENIFMRESAWNSQVQLDDWCRKKSRWLLISWPQPSHFWAVCLLTMCTFRFAFCFDWYGHFAHWNWACTLTHPLFRWLYMNSRQEFVYSQKLQTKTEGLAHLLQLGVLLIFRTTSIFLYSSQCSQYMRAFFFTTGKQIISC